MEAAREYLLSFRQELMNKKILKRVLLDTLRGLPDNAKVTQAICVPKQLHERHTMKLGLNCYLKSPYCHMADE